MLDHFSHSELACPTTDQVRLAPGFGEALERLRVELDAPIYLNNTCQSPDHKILVDGCTCCLHQTSKRVEMPALDVARVHALSNFKTRPMK